MTIDPILAQWLLGLLAALILAGVSFILRTLASQNTAMAGQSQALSVLIARVDPAVQKTVTLETSVRDLSDRVLRLEIRQGITENHTATSPVTVNV